MKGVVIWITGLSGSGKTTLAKKLTKFFKKKNINFLELSGDDLRNIFDLKGYDKKSRLKIANYYSDFVYKLSKKNMNICFSAVALFDEIQKKNRNKIQNYFEIFIDSDLKSIKKLNKKSLYKKFKKIIWGQDINYSRPKKPDFIIKNRLKNNENPFDIKILNKIFKKFNIKIKRLNS